MAVYQTEKAVTYIASADLSAHQYKFVVKGGTGGKQIALAGAGEDAVGVLSDNPIADTPGRVVISGRTKVVCGAVVPVDSDVMSDATGQAIVATGVGAFVLGKSEEAGVAGQVITVLLHSANPLTA